MTITGDTSEADISNVTPSSVTSATATVKEASLSWTPVTLTNKTVVGSETDLEIYRATLSAGTADSVKLNSVKLTTTATTTAFDDNNITKLDLYLDGKLLKSVSNGIVEFSGATEGTINFNSLSAVNNANVIEAGATENLVVKATFASTLASTQAFTLQNADATGLADVIARSLTGNKVVTVAGSITGGSRQITLAAAGDLKVELLTTDTKADENSFLLAGSENSSSRYMGEVKFTTKNEPVKVTRLVLTDIGATASSTDIKEVKLVKYVSGVPTVVATKLAEANGDVVFDPFNVVFAADQATSLFIVAVAKGMNVDGDSSSTAVYGDVLQYKITDVVANGDNSGEIITMADGSAGWGEWDSSQSSNVDVITGSTLNSITNPMSDGTLTGGTGKIIGKYTFTFDNGSNRDASNNEMKAIMDKLVITWSKSTNVAIAAGSVKTYIEGTATKVAADSWTGTSTGTTAGTATWNAATLQGLSGLGAVDGAVTLVVVADVTPSTDLGEFLQTSIADLNGAGGDDFNFIGDGTVGHAALTNMYLPVTEVLGATLSE
jgi:hypothetical protein